MKKVCNIQYSLNSNISKQYIHKISSTAKINKIPLKIKRFNHNTRCKNDKDVNLEAMIPTSIEGDIR